jgi:hypothetical protein
MVSFRDQPFTKESRYDTLKSRRWRSARPGVSQPAPPGTPGCDTEGMPVPPRRLKDLIEGTVDHHASQACPALQEVTITWHGGHGYMSAWAGPGDDTDEQIPLCRIDYLGDQDEWGFALWDPATETYTPSTLRTGEPTGHPNDAFDTAAIVHLTDYQQ